MSTRFHRSSASSNKKKKQDECVLFVLSTTINIDSRVLGRSIEMLERNLSRVILHFTRECRVVTSVTAWHSSFLNDKERRRIVVVIHSKETTFFVVVTSDGDLHSVRQSRRLPSSQFDRQRRMETSSRDEEDLGQAHHSRRTIRAQSARTDRQRRSNFLADEQPTHQRGKSKGEDGGNSSSFRRHAKCFSNGRRSRRRTALTPNSSVEQRWTFS